ncbi:MAG TPA: hypothetical protein VHO48_05470 [Anaerolineaceae bacterium]|jgi:hypothetical protein|nr:hypothetical protein [Anaerolineaceae bacterium]
MNADVESESAANGWWTLAALAQGGFYLITGLWPLIHSASFERVTGPKADLWLVKTVGVLVSVIGGILLAAGLRRRPRPEVSALGIGSAASLAGVDLVYTAQQRISPVYRLDAAAEIGLIVLWLAGIVSALGRPARSDYQI